MKNAFFRRGISAVCAGIFCASSTPAWGKSAKEVFAEVARSVVVVLALDSKGEPSAQGSGVVVGKNQIATNCHVVEDAAKIAVRQAADSGGDETYQMSAEILARGNERDLCLLSVDQLSEPPAAPIIKIGSAKKLTVGEEVFAVGAPNGLELSLSRGVVSQLRGIHGKRIAPLVQTDAAISPGSSGGGLFNENGELVGITTFKRKGESLNFAIPVEWVEDLLAGERLRWAAFYNASEVVAQLLEKGTDVDSKNEHGQTPLYFAARKDASKSAALLLEKGAIVNGKAQWDITPLHFAALHNASEVATLLLEKGADVNAKDEKGGDTPLHVAAYENSPEVADLLLEKGANINAKLKNGRTPLHWAASNNASETVTLLLEKGANVNSQGDSGWTPMDVAIHNNHSNIKSLLMQYGGKCAKKC